MCGLCGRRVCQAAWRLAYGICISDRRLMRLGRTAKTHLFCRVHSFAGYAILQYCCSVCGYDIGRAVRHHMLWWDWCTRIYATGKGQKTPCQQC